MLVLTYSSCSDFPPLVIATLQRASPGLGTMKHLIQHVLRGNYWAPINGNLPCDDGNTCLHE